MKQKIFSLIDGLESSKGRLCIGLLGFGKTNRAILDILLKSQHGKDITVYHKEALTLPQSVNTVIYDGGDVIDCDLLFVSPSVRREKLRLGKNTLVTSDTDLFFGDTNKNCFLISGSDGKSTVTAMTASVLKKKFPDIFLGGNIGTPIALCERRRTDAYVIELSSFNLRYTEPRSDRAVITNITPNHLNWHESYEEYIASKRKLLINSREPIINVDTPECAKMAADIDLFAACSMRYSYKEMRSMCRARHYLSYDGGLVLDNKPLIDNSHIRIAWRHNIENLMSCAAMTLGYCEIRDIADLGENFRGLPHRCETFLIHKGISFIDSSIDTSPARTRETLLSLAKKVRIILGGRGKGLDLSPLKEPLANYATRIAIYGDMSDELCDFIANDERLSLIPHVAYECFADALEYVTEDLAAGDTVLLSPAATSYGEFESFEARGDRFKKFIKEKYEKI